MFVEDLSSKYPKLSPYGASVCGRTDGCGWTVRPRFWIFWTQIFSKHLLKQPLRPCKQEQVGSYVRLCCQKFSKWANSDMLDIQDKRYWRWRLGRFKTDSVQGRFWWEEVRGDFIEVQVILINLCRFEWYVELILGLKLELTLPNNIIFNLWLLKLAPFVSQNFLTRMQKNKPFPFFFFLFSINLF